jgi:hypothetical protein
MQRESMAFDVDEIESEANGTNPRLRINVWNCVRSNTGDINDPTQNIFRVAPQGDEGPVHHNMYGGKS